MHALSFFPFHEQFETWYDNLRVVRHTVSSFPMQTRIYLVSHVLQVSLFRLWQDVMEFFSIFRQYKYEFLNLCLF